MTETVFVTTPLKVRFVIHRDRSGFYAGRIKEYPGLVSQARTADGVKRNLIRLLREISREHPGELRLFE